MEPWGIPDLFSAVGLFKERILTNAENASPIFFWVQSWTYGIHF